MVNNMEKVIYFNNSYNKPDCCSGEKYFEFLDYAFGEADYFMLVYVNYYGKGYSKEMKQFKNSLAPFQVKTRSNPSWPGTLGQVCPDTTYKIVFYKTDVRAREILKQVSCLSAWSCPHFPQDLSFFKGNNCWFYSVGHERIAAFIRATKKDLFFVEAMDFARREDAEIRDSYFDSYDEKALEEIHTEK